MRNAATFAEILETHLGCTDVPPAPRAWSDRPRTAPLFAFEFPLTPRRDTRLDRPQAAPPPPSSQPVTPVVRLTALEQRALAALNDLGAGLDACLTPATLRRAFRKLARRYHPDSHPGSTAAERQQMGRLFADATDHYRVLAASLEARTH